jgi:hypothetical protein
MDHRLNAFEISFPKYYINIKFLKPFYIIFKNTYEEDLTFSDSNYF